MIVEIVAGTITGIFVVTVSTYIAVGVFYILLKMKLNKIINLLNNEKKASETPELPDR